MFTIFLKIIYTAFPSQWLQRAIKYNTIDQEQEISKISQDHSKNNHRYKKLPDYKLVCYYSIPTPESVGNLKSQNIDANLCTHINVGFVDIKNNSIHLTPVVNEVNKYLK